MIKIEQVTTKRQWSDFLHLPWRIYKDNPYWVPPLLDDVDFCLNPQKNPFYHHARRALFLAYKNSQIVGRIAAIVDENYNAYHHEKTGWFGFFESIPDFAVTKALLDSARNWVSTQGMQLFRGPVNPSTNESCGLLVEGFDDSPYFMMTYNPPYYAEFLEKYGLKKAKDLLAYEMYLPFADGPFKRLEKIAIRIQKRYPYLSVRHLNMKDWENELKRVQEVYNSAWAENWGFVPMTEAEIEKMAQRLKPLVVPELVWLAEVKQEPVAFTMFLPDYFQAIKHLNGHFFPLGWLKFLWYRRKITRVRSVTLGIKKQYHYTGIVPLFLYQTGLALKKFPYQKLEFSWILEDNLPVLRLTKFIHARLSRRYRIYEIQADNSQPIES
ncbi:MAG: N-acetyltransferase [Candidatus Desulfofervidaceae bacterium]|nr:N-acetyltransferase [Candidatus Desulfofervidaceae bacterium]